MLEAGSKIIVAIESAWRDMQAHCPELPPVVAVTGSGLHQAGSHRWAHFWAERWAEHTDDTGQPAPLKPELFISGQLLAQPGWRIMQTLLHEAAHGLNHARKEKGTNVNGRHNKTFVRAAVELGCEWPEGKAAHKSIGFSDVEITEDARKRYAATIEALEAARLAHLRDLESVQVGTTDDDDEDTTETGGRGSRGGKGGGRRPHAVCACPEPDGFPITAARLRRTPIICGECDAPFAHPDDEDAERIAA
ncbi:hypothetical protein [Crossiella sp. CA198]|uniref:hypothetical protein n=1 Tax=Crossiella sp. CA198 TaxID=3455607 RepID=UPI003F8D87D4